MSDSVLLAYVEIAWLLRENAVTGQESGAPLERQHGGTYLLALLFGFPRRAFVQVSRKGDRMVLDGARLLESEDDLFHTQTGEALNFLTEPSTWRNIPLRRTSHCCAAGLRVKSILADRLRPQL